MNAFRTISRVLAVTMVVFAGNAIGNDYGKKALEHTFTAGAMFVAATECKEGEHAKKAAIETLGYELDQYVNRKKNKSEDDIDFKEMINDGGVHFLTNLSLRHSNDLAKYMTKNCDRLPETFYIKAVATPIVKTTARTTEIAAKNPEAVIFLGSLAYNYVLPMIISKLSK